MVNYTQVDKRRNMLESSEVSKKKIKFGFPVEEIRLRRY